LRPPQNLCPPKILLLLLIVFPACSACAQEAVFDVPSADILDNGKVYGELDGTSRPVDLRATFTPRVVFGIAHGCASTLAITCFSPFAIVNTMQEITPTRPPRKSESTARALRVTSGNHRFLWEIKYNFD
jgi:hypothetical protein